MNEVATLTKVVSDLNNEVSNFMNEVSCLMKEVFDLTNELSDLMNELSDLMNEDSDLMNELPDLMNELSDLMNEVSDLKNALPDLNNVVWSEERELLSHALDRWGRGRAPGAQFAPLAPEEQEEVPADPLLRLAVIVELPLVRVEPPVVMRAEDVVQVFVVNDRLDHVRRHVRRPEQRVNADLGRDVVVRPETDRPPPLA
jgi:chaperonin cofactor prefoldin